jgi:hypothetical protein
MKVNKQMLSGFNINQEDYLKLLQIVNFYSQKEIKKLSIKSVIIKLIQEKNIGETNELSENI